MYREFSKVPWTQRDMTQRNIVALGLLLSLIGSLAEYWKLPLTALGWAWPASMLWVGFWCAKGPIFYKNRWNADGTLQKWSLGYRIFVWLFAGFVVIGSVALRLSVWWTETQTQPFIKPIF